MPTMQEVLFKRKTTEEIEQLEIEDGSLIYNVDNGKTYMDYGNERIPTGGGANGGIYIGDTEPTDPDITLWVDTPTSETKASEIVTEYTESDKVGYSTNYINGLNGKILWTNPNPTSAFASQTITLSSDDYDYYEVIYYANATTHERSFSTGKALKGTGTRLNFSYAGNSGVNVFSRTIDYQSDNTFLVDVGYMGVGSSARTENNIYCVPLYIIGYKTGLFS